MSDEIVWQVIGNQFCAFKLKIPKQNGTFCRNEYNVTGLCNRQSCPLANSRYATVREDREKERIYLYIKTIERAHLPSKLWERIRLPRNYEQALAELDKRLQYWPKFLIHKCKQRLTRLVQTQIRSRKIAAEEERLGEKLVPKLAPKVRHREATRERKAEAAAKLERTIELELVERLRSGAYGDQPLNVSEEIWRKVLNAIEREGEGERDKDMDKGIEADKEVELERDGDEYDDEDDLEKVVTYVSDLEESEEELLDDIDDWLGSEDDEDEEDLNEESEDSEGSADGKAGAKRKRGRAIKMNKKKMKQRKLQEEVREKQIAW